jgi:phage repressor protein C with HTH and peptisase S24 domain
MLGPKEKFACDAYYDAQEICAIRFASAASLTDDARMTIGSTIRALRKERGLTLNQLAAEIGSDVGNLSRLERDQQGYSDQTLGRIAKALNVPMAALFAEDEEQRALLINPEQKRELPLDTYSPVEVVDIEDPQLTVIPEVRLRLTAGISGVEVEPEPFDGSRTTVPTDWLLKRGYRRDKLVAVRVRGESMEPALYEGDLVIVNLADTKLVAGEVYAVNYEGEPVIKRLIRDAGQWWLTSDHPDQRKHYRRQCSGSECIIVGRVIKKESERI